MNTAKERAELAQICYMTVERECAKPVSKINTVLVDACLDLASLLMGIRPLGREELESIKHRLASMTLRRRKKLKVRIIAAVLAVLLLLGTTAYAFQDWIVEVFGMGILQTIEPGDEVTVDNNVLEAAQTKTTFASFGELYDELGDMVLLPSKSENFEFINARYSKYDEYDLLITTWENRDIRIDYTATINSETLNTDNFSSQEFEYYSLNNQPYDIIDTGTGWQASTIKQQSQYTVFCTNKEMLIDFIDSLE